MERFDPKKLALALSMGLALAVPTMLPATALAQARRHGTSHRQKSKNQWRNLGYAGAAVGAAGLITHNKTLAIGGLAGGAYSAYRYEQDRKSQSREQSRHRRSHRFAKRRHHR